MVAPTAFVPLLQQWTCLANPDVFIAHRNHTWISDDYGPPPVMSITLPELRKLVCKDEVYRSVPV